MAVTNVGRGVSLRKSLSRLAVQDGGNGVVLRVLEYLVSLTVIRVTAIEYLVFP